MLVDRKCRDLAKTWLDDRAPAEDVASLASTIQQAIETWIEEQAEMVDGARAHAADLAWQARLDVARGK